MFGLHNNFKITFTHDQRALKISWRVSVEHVFDLNLFAIRSIEECFSSAFFEKIKVKTNSFLSRDVSQTIADFLDENLTTTHSRPFSDDFPRAFRFFGKKVSS